MGEKLRIATLNMEYGQYGLHAKQILDFTASVAPQVLLAQEIFPNDIETFLQLGWYTDAAFLPQAHFRQEITDRCQGKGEWGIGILTSLPINQVWKDYYKGDEHSIPDVYENKYDPHRGVLSVSLTTSTGTDLRVGNIHFIWTHDGGNSREQWHAYRRVQRIFADRILDITGGDWNIPRDTKLGQVQRVDSEFIDVVPPEIETTLDNERHRNSNVPAHVVDSLAYRRGGRWSIPTESVQVIGGVSDHRAVFGEVI
jgi:endonuclease/exonuclease/phosphatase family metal-dependent hydrolase